MTNYRERLASEIRAELGEHNDDDLPVVLLVARLRAENTSIKQQAQQWKIEAETQASIVRECYQICTGSTGEPGDWNGAEPVRKLAAERDAAIADATEQARIVGMGAEREIKLIAERDALAAVVSQVVECIGRLPHEPHGLVIDDLCRIVAPDPTAILAARDVRVRSEALREAQKACIDYAENAERDSDGTIYGHVHANTARALYNEIGRMADAIEKGGE